jgi:hypothetical protein
VAQVQVTRTVEEWRREMRGKTAEVANELSVAGGTDESYEAFVDLHAQSPFGPQAREWLDRHRRMVAWNKAVIANTAAGYRAFLAQYPDSDLTLTAQKLAGRLQYRANPAAGPIASAFSGSDTATAPSASPQPGATPDAMKKTETSAKKPKRPERQVIPRAPSNRGYSGGGGSYGGGYSRSGY